MRMLQPFIRIGRCAAIAVAVVGILGAAAHVATAQAKPKPSAAKKSGLNIMLMEPKQPISGSNQFEVMVKGADGTPIENADVSILFVMPPMGGMAEMKNELKLKSAGAGKYTGSGDIMMAGKWNVTVSVKQHGKEIGQKKIVVTAK
jgi:YtkA-like